MIRRTRLLRILCGTLLLVIILRTSSLAWWSAAESGWVGSQDLWQDRWWIQSHIPHIIVLPHFMIAKERIQQTYKAILDAYTEEEKTPTYIVLISPNHFGLGKRQAETIDDRFKTLCYTSASSPSQPAACVNLAQRSPPHERWTGDGKYPKLTTDDLFTTRSPKNSTSKNLSSDTVSSIATTKEHGLWEHLTFIKTYFPKAKILPIVLTPRSWSSAKLAYATLQPFLKKHPNTLVIASVDWSHYVQEPLAALHDRTSLYTLGHASQASGRTAFSKLEVDCPACLYAATYLAKDAQLMPRLLRRDSSSLILNREQWYGNTSRNVISFVAPSASSALPERGFTLTVVGDIIYDRAVKSRLSKPALLTSYFARYYQEWKAKNPPESHIHRMFFGSDLVVGNLETPIVTKKTSCIPSQKNPRFCSTPEILPYLKRIGFTHLTRANNHTFDGWREAAQETKKHLSDAGIRWFWLLSYMNGKFEDWTVTTWSIRGISYVLIGIDLTITPSWLMPRYCETIQNHAKNTDTIIVFPHRWDEYQPLHNAQQHQRAKQLIDCGADAIVWSHPHVPQDIERYHKKPIIYSVWNFIMDQWFSEATKQWQAATLDFRFDTKNHLQSISIGTWVVDAYVWN